MIPGLLFWGGVASCYGAGKLWTSRHLLSRRAWLAQTSRYEGTVVPSEAGLLVTSHEKQECVWARVVVEELQQGGRQRSWREVYRDEDGRPFYLDMADGERIRILPRGVLAELEAHAKPKLTAQERKELGVSRFALVASQLAGSPDDSRVTEDTIRPGDTLAVYADRFQTEPANVLASGYRSEPSARRVVEASEGHDVLLTNHPHRELLRALLLSVAIGPAALGVGVVMMVLSILL